MNGPLLLVSVTRPDGTLLWLPPSMLAGLSAQPGDTLSAEQWGSPVLCALISSRMAANKQGLHCNSEWHRSNGYN